MNLLSKRWRKKILQMLNQNQYKMSDEAKVYRDLAPSDNIENGSEYLHALEWALANERVKNIALTGPYGSGKSSIIETYIKRHPHLDCLKISMATFAENTSEQNENSNITLEEDEIETGILKQLFYRVSQTSIPQSRYRKLHRIGFGRPFCFCSITIFVILFGLFVFAPAQFDWLKVSVFEAGAKINLSTRIVCFLVLICLLLIASLVAASYRTIVGHFGIKEVKVPVTETTVSERTNDKESIFNKHLDEIVYFFEEMDYDVVFFEDLDRLNDSKLFVRLRELNHLLNNYEAIKHPVKFVYAVRDDIFTETDRTKFFEFIIPVVPFINSTNSGEVFLELLRKDSENGIKLNISPEYVADISPYISDMRLLQNAHNEFIVYKYMLQSGQSLALKDQAIMSLILFKNLYPRDFADLQRESGIVKKAFEDKIHFVDKKIAAIGNDVARESEMLEALEQESLKEVAEIKLAFLGAVTNWKGLAYQISADGSTFTAADMMRSDFNPDTKLHKDVRNFQVQFHAWNNSFGNFTNSNSNEIISEFLERWKRLQLKHDGELASVQQQIAEWKKQMHTLRGMPLASLIEEFGADEVLSEDVQANKLLVFMLRKGYIDEEYAECINYFKGHSITTSDMNFILSVKNHEAQPTNYKLAKTEEIVRRLQLHEFEQKEIYNFDLLEYLFSTDKYADKRKTLISQLSDGTSESWSFIDEFVDRTTNLDKFMKSLAETWHELWKHIYADPVLTYEKKIFYFTKIALNSNDEVIKRQNVDDTIVMFAVENKDFLAKMADVPLERIKDIIKALDIHFSSILTDNVSNDILSFIFEGGYYDLNSQMVVALVSFINAELLDGLEIHNYSTIMKLGYEPLLQKISEQWEAYVESFILAETNVDEPVESLLKIIENSCGDPELCVKVIAHQKCTLDDITKCEPSAMEEDALKTIWDAFFENSRLIECWGNVVSYWDKFDFTEELINYIDANRNELKKEALYEQDKFVKAFIISEINDETFALLIPQLHMGVFDLKFAEISESRTKIMIEDQYLHFSVSQYMKLKSVYPNLCATYILYNQSDYLDAIDQIPMNADMMARILCNEITEKNLQIRLLEKYGKLHMSSKAAQFIAENHIDIKKEVFWTAWAILEKPYKQSLMMQYLSLLEADDFEKSFRELPDFSGFIERKQHQALLLDSPENRQLAERLQQVGYITSWRSDKRKVPAPKCESSNETEPNVIKCNVKAIKC